MDYWRLLAMMPSHPYFHPAMTILAAPPWHLCIRKRDLVFWFVHLNKTSIGDGSLNLTTCLHVVSFAEHLMIARYKYQHSAISMPRNRHLHQKSPNDLVNGHRSSADQQTDNHMQSIFSSSEPPRTPRKNPCFYLTHKTHSCTHHTHIKNPFLLHKTST